jgi:hypothetical protein
LNFFIDLLKLGRANDPFGIRTWIEKLPTNPEICRFVDWIGPVADALCSPQEIRKGIRKPVDLPLPKDDCSLENWRAVSQVLGFRPLTLSEPPAVAGSQNAARGPDEEADEAGAADTDALCLPELAAGPDSPDEIVAAFASAEVRPTDNTSPTSVAEQTPSIKPDASSSHTTSQVDNSNSEEVAQSPRLKEESEEEQDDDQDELAEAHGSSRSGDRREVKWKYFAIGLESRGKWHHFRLNKGQWRHFGTVRVRPGRQEGLLELFIKGSGCLPEEEAFKLWYVPRTEDQRAEIRDKLEPELTCLRNLIREARRVPKRTNDPLPRSTDSGPRRWIAEIQFGGAGHLDGNHVNMENPIHFIPAEHWAEITRLDE